MKPVEEWSALRYILTIILAIAAIGVVVALVRNGAIFGNGDCSNEVGPAGQTTSC